MKLATLCIDGQTSAVRIEGRTGVVIDGVADLDDLDHVSVSIDVDGRRIARRSHAGTR